MFCEGDVTLHEKDKEKIGILNLLNVMNLFSWKANPLCQPLDRLVHDNFGPQ